MMTLAWFLAVAGMGVAVLLIAHLVKLVKEYWRIK